MHSRRIALCLLLILFVAGHADETGAASPGIRVGVAAIDISPTTFPVRIAGGFLESQANQMIDPLFARCFVFDDGQIKIVFAIVDSCGVPEQLLDEAKREASQRTGVPIDRMLISATHTHSAPAAGGGLGTRQNKAYAAQLPGQIADGILQAVANLQPARIGWATIDDWEHTHNRRWIRHADRMADDPFGGAGGRANMHPGHLSSDIVGPSGPVDPALSVLAAQTLDGKPLAVLANYSQHYFGAGAVSPDYYGQFCKHVANLYGQPGKGNGPFVCAMSQGTSGDLQWMDYGTQPKKISSDRYAQAVARYAHRALRKIDYQESVTLAMVEKRLNVKYRVPDEERLAWARPIVAKIKDGLPKSIQEVYANEAVILHELQHTEVRLQAIRIGDLTICALPNEVYALTGLKLRARSPASAHFNIELANGTHGYIPPQEQHALGGYTTWPARSAGLEVQAESKIVATLVAALADVTGKPPRVLTDEEGPYAVAMRKAAPRAWWRLNDADGWTARSAIESGPEAQLSPGFAWYLPGVGSGTGTGPGEKLTPSVFSGPDQINRAVHLAGGEIRADVEELGGQYSVALWVWLGEASGASERSGTLVTGPGGESLISRQFADHRVEFAIGDVTSQAVMHANGWHLVILLRDGNEVRVFLNGQKSAEIVTQQSPATVGSEFIFGEGLEGKLDEVAVFGRLLTPVEIDQFWRLSGVEKQRAAEQAVLERTIHVAPQKVAPPKFAANYGDAIHAIGPLAYHSLATSPGDMTTQSQVSYGEADYATFQGGRIHGTAADLTPAFSVSFWFCNQLDTETNPKMAYIFSRGPDKDGAAPGDHLGMITTLFVFNGNRSHQSLVGKTALASRTWNHVVLVRDGPRLRVFLNGTVEPEIDGEIELTAPGVSDYFFGTRSDRFAALQGQMAHIALFDRALTAEEAHRLHTASGLPAGQPATETSADTSQNRNPQSPPTSPIESLTKIHLPEGYRVELAACEPELLDPV